MSKNGHPKHIDNTEIIRNIIDPIVAQATDERPKTPLETDAHYAERLKKQLVQSLKHFQTRLQAAVKCLVDHHKWPKSVHREKILDLWQDQETWNNEIAKGKVLQEMIHCTDHELEVIYTLGFTLYNQAKYEDAGNIFLFLTQLNPKVGAFWSALGTAEERLGELKDAANAYLLAAELEFDTLSPYLHAAKCLLKLGRANDAKKVLQVAIDRSETESDLKKYQKDAEQMLQGI